MSIPIERTVLIVDDEPMIADSLAVILRLSGFHAHVAYNGEEALVRLNALSPDLLISDVMMPKMNGVELAIAVKRRCPACKVLLFSGVASSAHLLDDARKLGYDFEFLCKPVHPRDLLRAIA